MKLEAIGKRWAEAREKRRAMGGIVEYPTPGGPISINCDIPSDAPGGKEVQAKEEALRQEWLARAQELAWPDGGAAVRRAMKGED